MFKNMKLATKLGGGFGIILIALIIVSGVAFFRISEIQKSVDDLTIVHIPLFEVASEIDVLATEQELLTKEYALHRDEEILAEFAEVDQRVDGLFEKVKEVINSDQELINEGWLAPVDKMAAQHDAFVKSCNKLIEAVKADQPKEIWDPLADEMEVQSKALMFYIDGFLEKNTKETNKIAESADHIAGSSRIIIGIIATCALIIGVLLSLVITRSITKPINKIILGLGEGADQVAAASNQVSSASQSLAEGTAEQAASLEETSSSLEEMASMTQQNSDHATQADNLMKEANSVVRDANQSMTLLISSMGEISSASEETQKIVKTIDEIAFQTNLLALNAAVEAARAGEAGAGFAVVADEVRNLAMRAADAAKNTAELIEGTVKKVQDGSDLVAKTNEKFEEVAGSSNKVGQLVGEIAAASKEQTTGISQVNQAVSEMDKVVQQNSANAEENASASEEMNAQASQMKMFVADLVSLVHGSATNGTTPVNGRQLHRNSPTVPLSTPARRPALPAYTPKKIEKSPEEIIPMGEDEFQDF